MSFVQHSAMAELALLELFNSLYQIFVLLSNSLNLLKHKENLAVNLILTRCPEFQSYWNFLKFLEDFPCDLLMEMDPVYSKNYSSILFFVIFHHKTKHYKSLYFFFLLFYSFNINAKENHFILARKNRGRGSHGVIFWRIKEAKWF